MGKYFTLCKFSVHLYCLGVALAERGTIILPKIILAIEILSQMLERCKTAEEATTLSKGCQDLLFEVKCLLDFVYIPDFRWRSLRSQWWQPSRVLALVEALKLPWLAITGF